MDEQKKMKRRGRPQDRSKLTRNKVVQIRLTEDELAKLKAAASADEMTLADFVMAGVNQSRKIVVPGADELRSELIREGQNLNQALMLAHLARQEGCPVDMQSIVAAAERVYNGVVKLDEFLITIRAAEAVKGKKQEENLGNPSA